MYICNNIYWVNHVCGRPYAWWNDNDFFRCFPPNFVVNRTIFQQKLFTYKKQLNIVIFNQWFIMRTVFKFNHFFVALFHFFLKEIYLKVVFVYRQLEKKH